MRRALTAASRPPGRLRTCQPAPRMRSAGRRGLTPVSSPDRRGQAGVLDGQASDGFLVGLHVSRQVVAFASQPSDRLALVVGFAPRRGRAASESCSPGAEVFDPGGEFAVQGVAADAELDGQRGGGGPRAVLRRCTVDGRTSPTSREARAANAARRRGLSRAYRLLMRPTIAESVGAASGNNTYSIVTAPALAHGTRGLRTRRGVSSDQGPRMPRASRLVVPSRLRGQR